MRIAHFTPAYTPIHWGQTGQLLRDSATMARLDYEWMWWCEESTDIVSIRNRALRKALDRGFDYLVMQDSDVFSKASIGAVAILLETARRHKATAVAAMVGLQGSSRPGYQESPKANVWPLPQQFGDVYKAEKAGTGLIMIDCAQVASWEHGGAFFANEYTDATKTRIGTGEDIFFCNLIHQHGGSLYVDSRVPTTHVKRDARTLDYPGAVNGDRKADEKDAA